MIRLLVNADDFGLCRGVTEGIVEAHRRGIVTSTSIIASGRDFAFAVDQAHANPALGVGVHLTLVEERPVTDPAVIGTLVRPDGRLPRSYATLVAGAAAGRIRRKHIEAELRAQVDKVVAAGLKPTHLDSHQHVHALPSIFRMVVAIARDYGIRWIRVPRDSPLRPGAFAGGQFLSKAALCLLARYDVYASGRSGFSACHRMVGLFESGNLTEPRLLRILAHLPDGTAELVCHPGKDDIACSQAYAHWRYHWETELAALSSERVKDTLRARAIQLIGYAAMPAVTRL